MRPQLLGLTENELHYYLSAMAKLKTRSELIKSTMSSGRLRWFVVLLWISFAKYCGAFLVNPYGGSRCRITRDFTQLGFTLCLGGAVQKFELHSENSLELALIGLPKDYDPKSVSLHARMIGTQSIVNINLTNHAGFPAWVGSYRIVDVGKYRIQIRVSWLRGSLLDDILPLKGALADKFLEYSDYVDEILFDDEIAESSVNGLGDQSTSSSNKTREKQCIGGNMPGRWVPVDEKDRLGASYLNDRFGFNTDLVWKPYDCRYKLYTRREVLTCFKQVGTI
jgi:hypothetical protein